jgi:homoserine O-acetyltransferase
VIAALGGISAHRRVFDGAQPRAGWWCEVVGPDMALDSTRCRVLGIDYLGGAGESSRPQPGSPFPTISSHDQAQALECLLEHLQLPQLRAIVGASYGGMVALAFAQRFAARVQQLVVISGSHRAHPMATAWRSVQRRMVRFALECGRGAEGLELARALAMATYRTPREFERRFAERAQLVDGTYQFPVEKYLYARGRNYAAHYLPESFMCLSESIDLHEVNPEDITVPCDVIGVREDQLVPIADMRALAGRLPQARLHELTSSHGHDAFLKEATQLRPLFAALHGAPK